MLNPAKFADGDRKFAAARILCEPNWLQNHKDQE
jgi:hypothetical protein